MTEGFRKERKSAQGSYYRSMTAMGTRFEMWLCGQDAGHLEAVANTVCEEIVRLDGLLSRFDSRSEIARINREAGRKPARVDREVFALLARCEQARDLTEGYFDVMLRADISPALALDPESSTARFTRPDLTIDLGGVGKGYALDCCRELLSRFGVTDALLSGGSSSVLALGSAPGRNGWPVDTRHPSQNGATPVARLELIDRALSCSAVRRPHQGQSDLVNPLTGETLGGDAACVALAASATDAEILSTALLAMGRERAARYLEQTRFPDAQAGWIEPEAGLAWLRVT
jgi:thiamine biosynthesis lipoprotein